MPICDSLVLPLRSSLLRFFAISCGLASGLFAQGFEEPAWAYDGDLSERAQANAEVLAMRETVELEMDPALIAAIAADLEQIYAYDAGLAAAPARLHFAPGEVLVGVTDEIDRELEAGTYEPWNRLRGELGGGEARRLVSGLRKFWHFSFEVPYNSRVLVERIEAEWPGVRETGVNGLIGDSSDLQRSAALKWYAFILKWGDCPSGCTAQKRRLVAIEDDGTVVELEKEEAKARLEVTAVHYPEEMFARVGDTIHLRGEARLAPVGEPEIEVDSRLGWAVEYDGRWSRGRDRYSVYGPEVFEREWRMEVVEPLSGASWVFPQSLTRIEHESDALAGARYADHWLSLPVGWVNDRTYPWLWTQDHGWWWLAEEASGPDAWWAFDLEMGWLYIPMNDGAMYPLMHSGDRWLYYRKGSKAPREFYDYTAETWIALP